LASGAERDLSARSIWPTNSSTRCNRAGVEPVAASLFGFWVTVQYSAEEMTRYHPERESMAAEYTSVSNAWVGEPVYGLADLGLVISQDPRFTTCAVKTMAKALWRREPELHDLPTITELDQRFRAADQRLSALVAAITDTPQYQVGRLTDAAPAEAEERERTVSLLSAEQLRHVLRQWDGATLQKEGDAVAPEAMGGRVEQTYYFSRWRIARNGHYLCLVGIDDA
jgi:hypothetical protein